MEIFKTAAKAIVGGVVAAIGAAVSSLTDGALQPTDWLIIILAFIAGTGFVYTVPNKPVEPESPATL